MLKQLNNNVVQRFQSRSSHLPVSNCSPTQTSMNEAAYLAEAISKVVLVVANHAIPAVLHQTEKRSLARSGKKTCQHNTRNVEKNNFTIFGQGTNCSKPFLFYFCEDGKHKILVQANYALSWGSIPCWTRHCCMELKHWYIHNGKKKPWKH